MLAILLIALYQKVFADSFSNYTIYINGKPVEENQQVSLDDNITISFDWEFNNNNNEDYQKQLNLSGLKITNNTGPMYYRGEQIGDYSLSDNHTLSINLNKNGKKYSNITGGITLNAKLDVSDDKSEDNLQPIILQLGNTSTQILYKNPGTVFVTKSTSGRVGSEILFDSAMGQYYINYTISIEAKQKMSNIIVKDSANPNLLQVDQTSFIIKQDDNILDKNDFTIVDTPDGFNLTLPNIETKAIKHSFIISYRSIVTSSVSDLNSTNYLTNTATLQYTDENNQNITKTDENSIQLTKPKISKTAQLLLGSNQRYLYFYNGIAPSVPIQYEITISPGIFKDYLLNNPSQDFQIDDTFIKQGYYDEILSKKYLFHNNSTNGYMLNIAYKHDTVSPFLGKYTLSETHGQSTNSFADFKTKTGQNAFSSNDDLLVQLKNSAKIFGLTGDDYMDEVKAPITISDFKYNPQSNTFSLKYVLDVPLHSFYGDEIQNNVEATIFGNKSSATAETEIEIGKSAIISKASYNQPRKNYPSIQSYEENQNLLRQYATADAYNRINYSTAISLNSLIKAYNTNVYPHQSKTSSENDYHRYNWPAESANINQITITDWLNASCRDNGKITTKIIKLYAEYKTPKEVGALVGIGDDTVRKVLKENGIYIRKSWEYPRK